MRSPMWAAGLVAALALGLRLIHVFAMASSPFFEAPAVDAGTYAEHAARLAAGDWLGRGEGPFWQPPLYPYFLGAVRWLFPDSFFYAARIVQACIGTLTCVLLFALGRRLTGPGIAWAAALGAAVYGPLIHFDARLLPVGLATFLLLAGMGLVWSARRREGAVRSLAAGFVLGLASITVATILLLVPTAALWLARGRGGERRWLQAAALLVGAALAVAPVSWRNWTVGGGAVLISYNGGINFYIGNNAEFEKTLSARPGWEWERLAGRAFEEGALRPSQRSSFFYGQAFDYMRRAPWDFAALQLRKAAQFWRGDEIERNQEIYYWRKYSSVLAASLWKWGVAFPFGLVGPLALLGLGLCLCRRQDLLLPGFVVVFSLGVSAFFVVARYRLPLVPLLLLLAAYGGHWLYGRCVRGGRPGAASALIALLLLVAANWGLPPMDMRGRAATHSDLGNVYLRQGRYDMALLKYRQAVQRDPDYWQAQFNLGSIHAMQGDAATALPFFQKVVRHHPERAEAWSNLAGAYNVLGDEARAVGALERALERAEPHPGVYAELIRLYVARGATAEADALYHRALWDFPDDGRLGALHEAIKH